MKPSGENENTPRTGGGNLGTFAGVFTPSVLTILGIILFLRLGYVVGSAGLGRALVIIAIANAISVLTSFSLAAVATNIKVKGGGDYYLISRTLGVEYGGAIGIVLFLAQSVSIAFYCIGFGEAVASMISGLPASAAQIIAGSAVLFLFVFAWLGADWATKFQYVVMSLLIAALISFFIGSALKWRLTTLVSNFSIPEAGPGFWVLFAIFFPAVTGFTQGVSMSGDLKDPGKSLPLGTFSAVGISVVVYFGVAVLFAGAAPGEVLREDLGAMKSISAVGFFIHGGVIAATLSSGMASFLGAPRILQSLAGDRIFSFLLPFAKGSGKTNNPRRGVLLSGAIAIATVGLGKLDLIAPVVSMFFLISYGLLNYATYYESRAGSPSFRPRFRFFDSRLSLAGCLTCFGAMLAINISAGILAATALFAIYQYLKRTAGPARWADSRRSYHMQQIRQHLIAANREPEHPRDWRPQILAFSDNADRRRRLVQFASWLEGNSGLTTVVRILEGEDIRSVKRKQEAETEIRAHIEDLGFDVFSLVVSASGFEEGLRTLLQSSGIGPIKPNTVLLNTPESMPDGEDGMTRAHIAGNLRTAVRYGCNIIILKSEEGRWADPDSIPADERRIDIWWRNDATGSLTLLLGYLLTRNEYWEEAHIRLFAEAGERDPDEVLEEIREILTEARIEAEPEIVPSADARTVIEKSWDAAMVFFPFRIKEDALQDNQNEPLDTILNGLPVTALVLAAEPIDLDAEPEEGSAGELAAAQDALDDAEQKAKDAREQYDKAVEREQDILIELNRLESDGADAEALSRVRAEAEKAEEVAEKASRKMAKAIAKEKDAASELEKLGVKSDTDEETEDILEENPQKPSNSKN